FSGVDMSAWIPTTKHQNYLDALRWKSQRNQAERANAVRETGNRWSALHELRYFDVI
ncbi:uncharacterized protein BYT42DRAFT_477507, partial [Radiomyces spectabilis]|uniref:uncharacterized protein n=1 Tax=Radiomyces spectabilis TaxID=64574 RepID=UPI0022206C10